jgi:hypothetical protein
MSWKLMIPLGSAVKIGKDLPTDWIDLELTDEHRKIPWAQPCEVKGVKSYFNKHGVHVRHLPFDIGENVQITIQRKDLDKAGKLMAHKKLADFC